MCGDQWPTPPQKTNLHFENHSKFWHSFESSSVMWDDFYLVVNIWDPLFVSASFELGNSCGSRTTSLLALNSIFGCSFSWTGDLFGLTVSLYHLLWDCLWDENLGVDLPEIQCSRLRIPRNCSIIYRWSYRDGAPPPPESNLLHDNSHAVSIQRVLCASENDAFIWDVIIIGTMLPSRRSDRRIFEYCRISIEVCLL